MTMTSVQPADKPTPETPEAAAPAPASQPPSSDNPRRAPILAKTIFRELRANGLCEREIMAVASELLGQVAADLRSQS